MIGATIFAAAETCESAELAGTSVAPDLGRPRANFGNDADEVGSVNLSPSWVAGADPRDGAEEVIGATDDKEVDGAADRVARDEDVPIAACEV
jgi:hypothetical protein